MIAQNNVTHLYVAADAALTASPAAAPTVARRLGVKRAGEIDCDASALVAGDTFQILYMDSAGKLQHSPWFNYSDIVTKKKVTPTTDAAEVVAVGYNGTTGSIEVNNSGEYLLTVSYKSPTKMLGNKRIYRYGQYTADASATQYEIADGVQTSLIKSIAKDPYQTFKVEKINSGAQLNAMASATASVVNGSNVVILSEDESVTCPAGSFIRFGTTGAGTAPVYKVESISTSGLIVTLDQPYQGATNATFAHGSIETLTEGNWGLLITSNDATKPFVRGMWAFDPLRFDVGISIDFGATLVTVNTNPAKGIGTYKDIATIEWELVGNRREPYRIAEHLVDINTSLGATVGETYTVYTLEFKEGSTKTIGGTAESFTTLMIAAAVGGTLTTALDTLFTVS